jgi:RimJ/RimL family protein N-acetyltransferase
MDVYLETDRLVLRRFTADDLDDLVELDSDPEVTRYLTRALPVREKVAGAVIPGIVRYYEDHPGFGTWAAVEKATGAFIGWFHLRPAQDGGREEEPELGYRFHKAAWGKGYATEGSRALIERAFTQMHARRVFAVTMKINAGSRRVMEKTGLRFVRHFHGEFPEVVPGDEQGQVEYGITRAEWEADRRPPGAPAGT